MAASSTCAAEPDQGEEAEHRAGPGAGEVREGRRRRRGGERGRGEGNEEEVWY